MDVAYIQKGGEISSRCIFSELVSVWAGFFGTVGAMFFFFFGAGVSLAQGPWSSWKTKDCLFLWFHTYGRLGWNFARSNPLHVSTPFPFPKLSYYLSVLTARSTKTYLFCSCVSVFLYVCFSEVAKRAQKPEILLSRHKPKILIIDLVCSSVEIMLWCVLGNI